MAHYSLSVAAERTIADYLQSAVTSSLSPTPTYFTGYNNEDKVAPAVIVSARVGHELYLGTNIYSLAVTVSCKEIASDTNKDSLGVLSANVFNCFFDPSRNSNFSNTTYGFVTFQVMPQDMETETNEDTLVNKLTLDFVGCLSGTNSP